MRTVPDAKTVWLYRELGAGGHRVVRGPTAIQGYLAMGPDDASIVPVPKQRNSRDDNARIKDGETPEGWKDQPAKRSQKDTDARWTKKHGKSHYGYKNDVRGPPAQAGAALPGDRRGGARQPGRGGHP